MAWRRGWTVGLGALVWAACGSPSPVAGPRPMVPVEEPTPVVPEFLALFPASDGASVEHLVEVPGGDVFVAGVFRGDLAEGIAGGEGRNAGRCPDGALSDEEVFAARVNDGVLAWARAFGAGDGCAQAIGLHLRGANDGADEVVVGADGIVTFGGATLIGRNGLRLGAAGGADRAFGTWESLLPGGPPWALRVTPEETLLERAREVSVSVPLGPLQFAQVGEAWGGDAVVAGSVRAPDAEHNALAVWRVAPDGTVLWQRAFEFLEGAKGAERGFVAAEAVAAERDGGATLVVRFAGTLQLDVFVHGWWPEAWTESARYLVVRLERDGSVRWTREGSRGVWGGVRLGRAGNGVPVVFGVELTGDGVRAEGTLPAVLSWLDDGYGETVAAQPFGARVRALAPSISGGLLVAGSVTTGEGLGVVPGVAPPQTGFVGRLPQVIAVPER